MVLKLKITVTHENWRSWANQVLLYWVCKTQFMSLGHYSKIQLALEQHEFELLGSMQIVFNSKYNSATRSTVGWIQGWGTEDIEGWL